MDPTCIRESISKSVHRALWQLNQPSVPVDESVLERIAASVTFPNSSKSIIKLPSPSMNITGKPYDVELRIALTIFHEWKRQQSNRINSTSGKLYNNSLHAHKEPDFVTITSDLGLVRKLSTPKELADLLVPFLEEDLRQNPQWNLLPDVRCQPSGVLSLITMNRAQALRRISGMLPCPQCIKWCKGEKGLWWHQQIHHKQQHENAATVAQATNINESTAMVLYGTTTQVTIDHLPSPVVPEPMFSDHQEEFMEHIRTGNVAIVRQLVNDHKFQPATTVDRKGATPLMWAAGSGHLELIEYLIDVCGCDPMVPQKGKRSFAGRTALHWAARNGHLEVVQFLISRKSDTTQKKNLLEAPTQDGTTAFGWACWQRHLNVMEYLYQAGCAIDGTNSFGCSPVLWCSQGSTGDGLGALKWLQARGCDMRRVNHNGHGVLHKAAQRGQQDVGEWFVDNCMGFMDDFDGKNSMSFLALVGPDVEGYCPSDLAGMEGHEGCAIYLAKVEVDVCGKVQRLPSFVDLSYGGLASSTITGSKHVWEKYGGLCRMKRCLNEIA